MGDKKKMLGQLLTWKNYFQTVINLFHYHNDFITLTVYLIYCLKHCLVTALCVYHIGCLHAWACNLHAGDDAGMCLHTLQPALLLSHWLAFRWGAELDQHLPELSNQSQDRQFQCSQQCMQLSLAAK